MNVAVMVRRAWTSYRDRRQRPFVRNAVRFAAAYAPEKQKLDRADFFRSIVAQGQSPAQVNKLFAQLTSGPGKLTFEDFVRYRLYDPDGPSLEEKKRFASESRLHWKLVAKVSDPTYDALTQDKFITYSLLASFGFPVPKTLAVVATGARSFPGLEKLGSAEELQRFVAAANRKLFFKPNTGIGSYAAFLCKGSDAEGLVTDPHGKRTAAEIMRLLDGHDFLVQDLLSNHPALTPITNGAVSTIRLTNFLVDGDIHTPAALIKLPGEDAIADNFWRPGSMLGDIDIDTGRIRRVIRGHGLDTELLDVHPRSGHALTGFQIPFWPEVMAIGRACSLALTPLPFTSLDIAVCEAGPVVVEVNTGGSFDLPQLASGKGLLTPTVQRFFGLGQ